MKLTDAIAATIKLPKGKDEFIVWDETLPGFGLRLRRTSSGTTRTWRIQYRIGRQQRSESFDIRKVKLDAARKIARKRFAAIELGADPAADRQRARADTVAAMNTLGAVSERYLSTKKGELRPSSYSAARRYMTEHWRGLRAMPIAAIKRADIAAVLQEITAERGRISAARARANLGALFTWAAKEGLCDTNPVLATHNPEKGVMSRERVLDDGELRAVWRACNDDAFGRIIKLLILSGCRRCEIGDLRWSEIDLESGVLVIPGERVKGRRTLMLTLPPMAIEILRAMPRRDGQEFVFGKAGRAGFVGYAYALMALNARIAVNTGRPLAPWVLHDLRRSMRTGLGKIGVAPHIAEIAIGHAQPGIRAIYDRHSYQPEIKAALLRWAEHVAAIVEDRASNVVPLHA
jgi:integrase